MTIPTINELEQRKNELRQLIRRLQHALRSAPEGKLYVSVSKGTPQYYVVNGGEKQYLPKKDLNFARRLAKRDYERKLLSRVEKEHACIERFLRAFDPVALSGCYEALPEARKCLVEPEVDTPELFVAKWEENAEKLLSLYQNSYPVVEQFVTNKGERVRSKSELIIANLLERHKIPYRYELPLVLSDSQIFYPDFTVLNVPRQKVMYWEHFGLMDESSYSAKTVSKMNAYARAGIKLGERLLFTMESRECPLDVKMVGEMIREYLL